MIPNHTNRNVQTSGVSATGEFQISLAHSAHIMRILRSQLYSNKILAVEREYAANAWDANREVGKGDVPIKVVLPTVTDPTLYIRDFGPGISHEDMFSIYAQYGVSTKRSGNGQVGMLGIGSKSGFAYTDSFTITTWQNGTQRIYTAVLDNDEKGTLNLLDESESDEPTGTMVQIPVRPIDIPSFVHEAEKLFFHFKPRPDINISLPPEPVPEVVMRHGSISRGHGSWMAVMGCIAYEIDLRQLRGLNAHRGGASDFLDRLDGYLYFDIGEVEIAASREGLEYSDKTKRVLIDKLIDIIDEFVKHTLDNIEAGDFSFWEKRCRAQVINDLRLPVPPIMKSLTDEKIYIEDPKSFVITYSPKQTQVHHIHVGPSVRLIIRDEFRRIDGYGLSGFDYVIRQNADLTPLPTLDEVRKELAEIIEKQSMTGVQVVDISTIPWHAKAKFSIIHKKTNRKHQVKTFVLKQDKGHYNTPWSNCWDIEERTPDARDVFVLLRGFKVIDKPTDDSGDTGFYSQYSRDRELLEALKVPVPKVYGYKSTEKEPMDMSNVLGTKYGEWRMRYFKEALNNQKVKDIVASLSWVNLIVRSSRRHHYRDDTTISPKIMSRLFTSLGKDHLVCVLLRRIAMAHRTLKRIKTKKVDAVKNLMKVIREDTDDDDEDSDKTEQELFKENIEKEYPMFQLFNDGINDLLDNEDHVEHWINYIKVIDMVKKGLSNDQDTTSHSNGRSDHNSVEGESPCSEEGRPELQQSQECDQHGVGGRELGEDSGPLDGVGDSEGLVERQIRSQRRFGDLLRAVSP